MRVLVTGASGGFGVATVERLIRAGHDVIGLSRSGRASGQTGLEYVAADIRDGDAVAKAMAGCDAVVHLAWNVRPQHDQVETEAIDMAGTTAVLEAMKSTGTPRLVFASSVTSYGAHPDNPEFLTETDPQRPNPKHLYEYDKMRAEQLIDESGVEALHVRATIVLGRHVRGTAAEVFNSPAQLGIKGAISRLQCLHQEDLGRFMAQAVEEKWTGPVNLAAPEGITTKEVAQLLGVRYFETTMPTLKRAVGVGWKLHLVPADPEGLSALVHFPIVDITRLTEEFGFQLAWSGPDTIRDFARGVRGERWLGPVKVTDPRRWPMFPVPQPPWYDEEGLQPASPLAGELDTPVDPAFPLHNNGNTSEAMPGPMTPLSLEAGRDGLLASTVATAKLIGGSDELVAVMPKAVTFHGHGFYGNMSVIHALARQMPGYDPDAWDEMMFGRDTHDGVEESSIPAPSVAQLAAKAPKLLAQAASLREEVSHIAGVVRDLHRDAVALAAMSDPQLEAHLRLLKDWITQCWSGVGTTSFYVTAALSGLEQRAGKDFATSIRSGVDSLESTGLVRGVHELAELARGDGAVAQVLRTEEPAKALETLRREHPSFATTFDRVITDYGHRGPRETDLANTVFADDPPRLLLSVRNVMDSPAPTTEVAPAPPLALRKMADFANYTQQCREIVRDAMVRATHSYRLAARERGSRLVEAGVLARLDDVFFLLLEELQDPPADAQEIAGRRRADHERLKGITVPALFNMTWEPVDTSGTSELAAGEALSGLGVSAGTTTGPVRVVDLDTLPTLQPGEILVTRFTDTGWTPYFAFAAAVVVDTGGEMSHAAVVAREFGIPCVVNIPDATARLRTGMTVTVDGRTGLVTRP